MTFGLRRQLLLIGVLTLLLPIASVFYIRETENALRQAQGQFLSDLARSTAPLIGLDDAESPLAATSYPDSVFALPLTRTPTLDGYREDWGLDDTARPATTQSPAFWLGDYNGTLWLHARLTLADPAGTRIGLACVDANGDFNVMSFLPNDRGTFALTSRNVDAPVRASWQPDARGGQLEIRIPGTDCARRLGLSVSANDINRATYSGSLPGPVRRVSRTLTESLRAHRPAGVDAYLLASDGWRLTPVIGDRATLDERTAGTSFTATLYRRLLGNNERNLPILSDAWRILPDEKLSQASAARVRSVANTNDTVTIAQTPLTGALADTTLVLRQNTSAILTLANPSLVRLTNIILIVTVLVVGLLLAYASWLSARVRRLARAAATAVSARGDISTRLPGNAAVDEIGDVTRGFETLLGRVREQQQWLKSLADTLSHELRTPIAVVQSSLDNLGHSALSDAQRALAERASDGVARLRAILNAMSTANRAEQAARDARFEQLDLSGLLAQLADAYRQTFARHGFTTDIVDNVSIEGNAELLVQMLDKLVENATQFAPDDSDIVLSLNMTDDLVTLRVSNTGPALPAGDSARLFDSFVTQRRDDTDSQHMGFGLYIARLIAEAHRGRIAALDTMIGTTSGVTISVTLPAMVAGTP
ncbi:MAG: ATP-binding protein [Pseudomonadota bacterium]